MTQKIAGRFPLACLAALVAGCTSVVDGGTVIRSPQVTDASGDTVRLGDGKPTLEELCTATGGTVEARSCCSTTDNFPRLCGGDSCNCDIGAQGVTMQPRQLCICRPGQCFLPMAVPPTFSAGCVQVVGMPGDDAGPDRR